MPRTLIHFGQQRFAVAELAHKRRDSRAHGGHSILFVSYLAMDRSFGGQPSRNPLNETSRLDAYNVRPYFTAKDR
jgi:hypothetical protein